MSDLAPDLSADNDQQEEDSTEPELDGDDDSAEDVALDQTPVDGPVDIIYLHHSTAGSSGEVVFQSGSLRTMRRMRRSTILASRPFRSLRPTVGRTIPMTIGIFGWIMLAMSPTKMSPR